MCSSKRSSAAGKQGRNCRSSGATDNGANRSLPGCVCRRYNRLMISIVDYGMGNLRSVQKACEKLGVPARICTRPDELENCERMILPGVGAFRDAITELRRKG